jgi:Transposase DDE domain
VDPESRHTRKSPEARRDGYRAHAVAEPDTGIITDEQLTKAAGTDNSDPAVAERFLAADITAGNNSTDGIDDHSTADEQADGGQDAPARREWYGDSAYGTGDLRGAIDDAGHQAVIKPKPLQSPVEGGFTVDDFTVDEQQQTVTCPNGNTRPISATRIATFGSLCRDCPLRAQCTTAKTGRKIVLHERDDLLRQARRDWTTKPDLRERYRRHRPNIERVIAQIATRGGRRLKLRYHGTDRNNAWLKRRTAVLNLRNLINRGLHYTNGWALATT